MTASHVVPKECEDSTSIKIYWNEKPGKASLSHGVEAKVIARSSLDAALLQLLEQPQSEVSDGEDRQYLMIEEPQEDKENIVIGAVYSQATTLSSMIFFRHSRR